MERYCALANNTSFYRFTSENFNGFPFWISGLSIALLMLAPTTAWSCNIPVFRYALERWEADDYELVVYFEGELTESSVQLLRSIQEVISPTGIGTVTSKGCNLRIVRVDLKQSASEEKQNDVEGYRQIWKESVSRQHATKLPYAVLRTSPISGQAVIVWQGKLEDFMSQRPLESPIRNELSRRLMRGDSVVWLMVNSSQSAKNQQVRKVLSEKSHELQKSLELPEGIGLPGSELYSDVPLLLEFSILEFNRDDPQESHLNELLSKLAPDAVAADEPLIVPVFGRGRALEVIPGNQLDAGMIGDLAIFLSGACSCQVKERNPGFDLLLRMNWHNELFDEGVAPPPPDEGLRKANPNRPTLLEIPAGKRK